MGRIGEPGDIANAVVFLVSPESGWITAQMLTVDGGRMDYVGQVNLGSVGLVQGRTSYRDGIRQNGRSHQPCGGFGGTPSPWSDEE